jgi:tetratricopeptide (TPR) repeat protein
MRQLNRLVFASALAFSATLAFHPSGIPDAHAQKAGDKAAGDAAKPDDGLEFEPESATSTPPSKTLERAVKLYDKKDYFSASIELQKVLSGESGDDEKNKQRAEFFMGKTLYKLGFYAGSLAYFDKIVAAGAAHTYHAATLKWLAALSRVLPETSGILEKIGTYDPAALEDPIMAEVRDELYYLLGRNYYRRGGDGDFDKAIELFNRVGRQSEFFIKAKFFEGVTYVRKFEGKPAIEAFKAILVIGQERPAQYKPEDIVQYNELAILQMARVFYSTQQFDTSIKYYEKLDQASPDWTTSLFEASWAYFMKTNNSKALGNIHSLNAPFFEDEFYPESVLLRAVIYFNYCLYDRALEAIQEFDTKYKPLTKNLRDLMEKYDDNAEFYDYIKKVIAGKAGLDDKTQRLVMSVLTDKQIKKEFAWVDELQKELDALAKSDRAWQTTAVAAEVNQELTVQKSLADGNAGKVARDRVERLVRELGALARDGRKIQFEILNAMADKISAESLKTRVSTDHKEEPIIVDDEHFTWKFNGEYWKDELGYYRFRIRSKCPKR